MVVVVVGDDVVVVGDDVVVVGDDVVVVGDDVVVVGVDVVVVGVDVVVVGVDVVVVGDDVVVVGVDVPGCRRTEASTTRCSGFPVERVTSTVHVPSDRGTDVAPPRTFPPFAATSTLTTVAPSAEVDAVPVAVTDPSLALHSTP
jgi:hypothetical protein